MLQVIRLKLGKQIQHTVGLILLVTNWYKLLYWMLQKNFLHMNTHNHIHLKSQHILNIKKLHNPLKERLVCDLSFSLLLSIFLSFYVNWVNGWKYQLCTFDPVMIWNWLPVLKYLAVYVSSVILTEVRTNMKNNLKY